MKKQFSISWKSSSSPKKQRKYRSNSPLHIKRRMLAVHLSKDLRSKYGTRNVLIRKGDSVVIMRGKFSGTEGKVDKVFTKQLKVTIDSAKVTTKKGNKVPVKIRPSALMIKELNMSDKMRASSLEKYGKTR